MSCSEVGDNTEPSSGVAWQLNFKNNSGESIVMRSHADEFDYSEAMESSVMKIYDASDRLVRRYEPIAEAPEYIFLTEGDYRMTVVAGESLSPTDYQSQITFEGETLFTVTSAATNSVG